LKRNNLYQKIKHYLAATGLLYAFWKLLKFSLAVRNRKKKHQQDCYLESGPLRILLADLGIQIFWSGKQLTLGSGLNIGVNTLGLWTDSTKGKWQLLEKGPDFFKVRVSFDNLPIVQAWKINICDKGNFIWEIETQNTEWLHIDELRIVQLLNSNYTYWFCAYEQGAFCSFQKDWFDFKVNPSPFLLTGVRFPREGSKLPALALEIDNKGAKVLIQNSSYREKLRIIGFSIKYQNGECDFPAGSSQSFRVHLQVFQDDADLDSKIELLRQDVVREVFKESKVPYVNKRLKILLVNLPWYKNGAWGVRAGSRWPHTKDHTEGKYLPFPFFLAQATSLLQKNSVQAEIIDAVAEQLSEDAFIYRLLGKEIDYLVAETSIPSFLQDMEILSKISKNNIKIILCGPNSLIYQPAFMRQYPFIDFVLRGEYEFTLLDLIRALENNSDLSAVNGILYRKGGEFLSTAERKLTALDYLPWPHRDSLPMEKYWDLPGDIPTPSVQMLASRGCPFNCNFCLWPQVMYRGNSYRVRNTDDVINEMEYLVKNLGFKSVYFDDDTFNIGKERMLEFCQKLQARGLSSIPWAIMARADTMDEQTLLAMKKSGLAAVKYGVETFNPEFIASCQKGLDISKAEAMIRLTKKLGIKVHLTFTFGFAGETKKTIKKTIERGLKLDPDSVQFSILTPFPGTRLFEQLDSSGKILTYDWTRYDGSSYCVFKSEGITAKELLAARKYAYFLWGDYQRKKRGFLGDLNRFKNLIKLKGISCAIKKTFNYLRFLLVKNIKYLNGKY
jgi:radical SAM superfamily enzyme YgiQ (UPF0313 family)